MKKSERWKNINMVNEVIQWVGVERLPKTLLN